VNVTTLGSPNGAAPTLDDIADAIYRMEKQRDAERDLRASENLEHAEETARLAGSADVAAGRDRRGAAIALRHSGRAEFANFDCGNGRVEQRHQLHPACDMSRVVVGIRSTLQVLYDPFSLSSTDQIVVRTTSRWGIALLDEEAVEVIAGVRT
jgi:hypothetical protein